jgi:hypothetical protein
MEKKIIAIMVALVMVAAVVVTVVMIAAGGLSRAGGFSNLFDELEYSGNETDHQLLEIPDGWYANDVKTVSDVIVDMAYTEQTNWQTTVYLTTLYFMYIGDQWTADPSYGTYFYVPVDDHDGVMAVSHGLFSFTVSSATNLSAVYDIGDVIKLRTTIVLLDDMETLAFGAWSVADTL